MTAVGALDIVVANAGIQTFAPATELDTATGTGCSTSMPAARC